MAAAALALVLAASPVRAASAASPPPGPVDGAPPGAGLVDPAQRAWDELTIAADAAVQRAEAGVAAAVGYASRAAVEFLNVLGMNRLEPPPEPGAPPATMPELPNLALPPEPREPPRETAPAAAAMPRLDPAEVRHAATATPPAPPIPSRRLGEGFVNDTPHKLPDGTLVVPKAAQRLYALRTAAATLSSAPVTAKLDGVVIPDPSRGGQVQASFVGRVEPVDTGMPFLGMSVERGQVIAYLRSALTPAERAHMRNEIARLTTEIVVAEKKIERLGVFVFVPFREGKIVYERLHLEGLKRQREALLTMLTDREPIRASATGVISAVNVSTGQIVETRQTMFEIVDPDGLWIEAIAYDPSVITEIAAASAVSTDGVVIPLRFVGSGLELRQQAVPLHFRLEAAVPNLQTGKPVSVIIQTRRTQPGIVLPNDSIVRTGSGQEIAWEKVGPEQFAQRIVTTRPLDATRLYVVAGIDPDATVVTTSARLLSQFR